MTELLIKYELNDKGIGSIICRAADTIKAAEVIMVLDVLSESFSKRIYTQSRGDIDIAAAYTLSDLQHDNIIVSDK